MKTIYLDNNATTPIDPQVLEAMMPYLTEQFGNAASSNHCYGWEASLAVAESRKHVAKLLNVPDSRQVLWTSGATESNNIAIQGVAQCCLDRGLTPHIITSTVEHKAVISVCKHLEKKGVEVTYLPVNKYGQIEIDELKKSIKPNTKLISLMAANNEVGSLNPVKEIGKIANEHNIIFHCDAAQATGKVIIDVQDMNIDMLSMSAHKMYGPKGIGALYVKKGTSLCPLLYGSAEEKGLRPGTLNVAGIVGLAKCCEISLQSLKNEAEKLCQWRDRIINTVLEQIPIAQLNGHPTERLPNNISFSFNGLPSDLFSLGLKNIACSSTSACSTAEEKGSYVLKSMGLSEKLSQATVRLGLGRFNTEEDVDFAIKSLSELYKTALQRAETLQGASIS